MMKTMLGLRTAVLHKQWDRSVFFYLMRTLYIMNYKLFTSRIFDPTRSILLLLMAMLCISFSATSAFATPLTFNSTTPDNNEAFAGKVGTELTAIEFAVDTADVTEGAKVTYTITDTAGSVAAGGLSITAGGLKVNDSVSDPDAILASIEATALTQKGTYNFTVTASDTRAIGAYTDAINTYTLVVAAGTLTMSPDAGALTAAVVGVEYNPDATVTFQAAGAATGDTYVYNTDDTLPAGLTLSPGGVLSGKPTAAATGVAFQVTATAQKAAATNDDNYDTVTQSYTIDVTAGALTLDPVNESPLIGGVVGTAYTDQVFTASGAASGATYTFSSLTSKKGSDDAVAIPVKGDTAVPFSFTQDIDDGVLTLKVNTTLAGIGNYVIAFTVTSSDTDYAPATVSYGLVITAGALTMTPDSGSLLTEGAVGTTYTDQVFIASGAASDATYTFSALTSKKGSDTAVTIPVEGDTVVPFSYTQDDGGVLTLKVNTTLAGAGNYVIAFTVTSDDDVDYIATPASYSLAITTTAAPIITVTDSSGNIIADANDATPAFDLPNAINGQANNLIFTTNAPDSDYIATGCVGTPGDVTFILTTVCNLAGGLSLSLKDDAVVLSGTTTEDTAAISFTLTVTKSEYYASMTPVVYLFNAETGTMTSLDLHDVEVIVRAEGQAALRLANIQMDNIHDRLQALHNGRLGGFTNGINLSAETSSAATEKLETTSSLDSGSDSNATTAKPAAPIAANKNTASSVGVWTSGTIVVGSGKDGGKLNFNANDLSVGMDWRMNEQVTIGGAASIAHDKTDIINSKVETNNNTLSLYGSYKLTPDVFVDGILGTGWLNYDVTRALAGTDPLTIDSKRKGSQMFGSLTAGYQSQVDDLLVTYYGRADYTNVKLNQSSEGDVLNGVIYGKQIINSLDGVVGVSGQYHGMVGDVQLVPNASIELGISNVDSGKYLIDSRQNSLLTPLSIDSATTSSFLMSADIGTSIIMDNGISFDILYRYSNRNIGIKSGNSNSLTAGVSIGF